MASKTPMQEVEVLSLKPHGLFSYPNPLASVPQGAMTEAINVVLSRPEVVEQRRGIRPYGTLLADDVKKLFNYQNTIIIQHGDTLARDSDNLGTWIDYSGTYDAPSGALTIKSLQANKNFYFTTAAGIKKLDAIAGTIASAGAPAGLDGSGTTTGSGWFVNLTQVAYRILFGYTDANNNLVRGAPSQRIVVSNNSGGDTNVSLTFTLPAGLTTAWQYQIYRSPMSVDLNTEPNDECALVYTGNPTSGDLTAGYVTITDSINDSLKGETIYTAPSQQGIAQSNYQPPIATDAVLFKGFAMYSEPVYKEQLFLTLVSVGGSGLVADDTVTIAGTVYTAKTSETIASGQFKVFTGGTPSQNITDTANSLVRVINRYASNTVVYAYYSSGYNDLPGRILLAERGLGAGTFTAASSRSGAFVPNISTAFSSSNQSLPNGVAIAKYQQPEAVPAAQYILIGSADKRILRIIALRDYVLVYKQDGIFQITGTDINSFQASLVDDTVLLRGIDTAVSLNNKVFSFSNQTVISMNFNEGAVLKSLPIKKDLLVLSSPLFPTFDTVSYGIAYESENQYLLGTVSNTLDTTVTQYFVYNYLTDTWTTWQFPYTMGTGFVNPTDGKLYFGSTDSTSRYVYQERKDYVDTDFADNSYDLTVTGSSGTTLSVTDTTNVLEGYTVKQGESISEVVTVVNATTLLMDSVEQWEAGDATAYKPIPITLRFLPEPCGNPGIVHHFKEVQTIFSTANFDTFDLGFSTDFNDVIGFSTLMPKISSAWGTGPWSEFPWGGGAADLQVIRGIVPLGARRGHWLKISINYSGAVTNFALDGFAIYHQAMSQKFH